MTPGTAPTPRAAPERPRDDASAATDGSPSRRQDPNAMTTIPPVPPPSPSRPSHRGLRNAGLLLLGVLGFLVLGVAVCEFIEWPFLRHPLERRLTQALARDVRIGPDFGVRLIGSVRAHADELVIGPGRDAPAILDDHGQPRDLMDAQHVRLALSYATIWRIWHGDAAGLQVRRLDVDGLELNLRRGADGHANWQFGAAAAAPSAASAPPLPRFEELVVRDGVVRVVDEPLQVAAEAKVRTREGSAEAAGPAASSTASVAPASSIPAQVARAGSAPAAAASAPLERGLEVVASGTYRRQPLSVSFHSSGVLALASSDASTPPVPLWLDAHSGGTHIHVEGRGTDVLHFGGLDATFEASGPSLAAAGDALGITLPTTATFTTHGRLRKQGAVWDAGVGAITIGSSRLHGDFRFDTSPAVPELSGTLRGSRLALPDLGPAFGGSTAAQPKTTRAGHVLPAREFDIPSLRAMNADVGVALDSVDLGTSKIEPFVPLHATITLQDGVLRLHDILARTSQGQVQGAIGLDSRPAQPKWDAELRWSGIELQRFVKARDVAARGHDGAPPAQTGYVGGGLGGTAHLRGTGRSTAALLASLDGDIELWVSDGTISHLLVEAAGIDIAQGLGVYVKGDDPLPMRCAVAAFEVARGRVTPEVGVIDTHDSTMLLSGDLSLADETLDLTMTTHPHDTSPVALRSPVKVDGTFSQPHVHLKAGPIAARAGAAVALATITPLASLLALVDFRQKDKDVCTGAVNQVAGAARTGIVPPPAPGAAASASGTGKDAAAEAAKPQPTHSAAAAASSALRHP
jgi:uncharacterized protein involved in outer membrane biogenesis